MDIKKHYEKYWTSKDKKEEFFMYERNWVLPSLFPEKEKILDLGCGDGVVAEFLQKDLGMDVIGCEISTKATKEARRRGVKVIVGNIEKGLPFKDGEFDTVFWGDNIEHLFAPMRTLVEIRRVLKRKGRLVLSCPNMGYWRYRIYHLIHGRLPDTEWTGNPPWAWDHIRFFNGIILKHFLESGGFRLVKIIGVNKRFPDKYFVNLAPGLFGMILVIEANKNG